MILTGTTTGGAITIMAESTGKLIATGGSIGAGIGGGNSSSDQGSFVATENPFIVASRLQKQAL